MHLEGKVAIVTGSGHGIGKAYASGLAAEGAKVVIAELDESAAYQTEKELVDAGYEALAVPTDVAVEESTLRMAKKTMERFGRIDILINNASVFVTVPISRVPFDQISLDEWDLVMRVNLKGMFLCCRAVVPYMRTNAYGKIVNISSNTIYHATGNRIHYVTSKAGVIGFTRTLARELGDDGICVNAIAPGSTLSEDPNDQKAVARREKAAAKRCLKRVQTPEDLVGTAIFLASPESDFITGQTIIVDGGDAMI